MKKWIIEIGGWVLVFLIGLLVVLMLPCVLNPWGNAVCKLILGWE